LQKIWLYQGYLILVTQKAYGVSDCFGIGKFGNPQKLYTYPLFYRAIIYKDVNADEKPSRT